MIGINLKEICNVQLNLYLFSNKRHKHNGLQLNTEKMNIIITFYCTLSLTRNSIGLHMWNVVALADVKEHYMQLQNTWWVL